MVLNLAAAFRFHRLGRSPQRDERTILFDCLLTDGIRLLFLINGDFGRSPFLRQLSAKANLLDRK
jgi:hypothetical protein